MDNRRFHIFRNLFCVCLLVGAFTATLTAASARLEAAIDDRQTFVLHGNIRPAVVSGSARDQGAAEGSLLIPKMSLHFALTTAQQADLDRLLIAQQDPNSPHYHKFLTPEEYADRFGLASADLAQVTAWLQNSGFANIQAAHSRAWIVFSGTAAQVQTTFHTAIHEYEFEGKTHFANASEPQIPVALAGVVRSVRGLHNFRLKPHLRIQQPNFTSSISGDIYTAPDDWETIYNVKPLYSLGLDATGVTIAVVGQSLISLGDVDAFRLAANLSLSTPTVFVPSSYTNPGYVSGDEEESDLDVEWSGAIAKNAHVMLIAASATAGNGVDDSIMYAIDNNVAPIMSTSYGLCEADLGATEVTTQNSLFQQANAQGMTVVAAGGDAGAADCNHEGVVPGGDSVEFPASSPYVTGVGGTAFNEGSGSYWGTANNASGGSALSYIPEQVWNDSASGGGAGGGGASLYSTKPVWQTGTGVPADGARDVPDLAFDASPDHDPLLFCGPGWCANGFRNASNYLDVIGGTSAGAPSFAGVLALLIEGAGGTPLGNVNPRLYALAASAGDAFNDVKVGNNVVPCIGGGTCPSSGMVGFLAGVGYDQASGWGSLNVANFVLAWTGKVAQTITFLPVATQNAGGTLTLNVTASSGLPVTLTSSTQTVCTVAGNSVALVGSGVCTITAYQAGSSGFFAATPANQSFNVVKILQTLSFSAIAIQRVGDPTLILADTASSGLPVYYSATPISVCNGAGNTVNFDGPGVCTLVITSLGSNVYLPVSATESFLVIPAGTAVPSLQFAAVAPCRIADTRLANGPFGGPKLAGGSSRSFTIPNSACNIPSSASAYSLNITVVPDGGLGFLSIWPTGQTQPMVSTLNSDSRTKANAAIVPAGANGSVSVYASDPTHVILDVNGYFIADNSAALNFYPLPPCRLVDTRNANGSLGGPYLSAGVARSFPVQSAACGLPATSEAYSLNFTVVPRNPLGYLTTWPTGQAQPLVSTLNAFTKAVTANAAIVPAGTGGAISVYASDDTDVVIDMNGYFAPPAPGGLSLYAVTPCRVLDTRTGSSGPLNGTLNVNIEGSACNISSSAQAFVLNATVVPPAGLGFLTLWPSGSTQPLVSTLNDFDSVVTSNMAIVPTANGIVSAYGTNPTQLLLDVSSYFAP